MEPCPGSVKKALEMLARSVSLNLVWVILAALSLLAVVLFGFGPSLTTTWLITTQRYPAESIDTTGLDAQTVETILLALRFSLLQAGASATLTVAGALLLARLIHLYPSRLGRFFLAVAQVPFGLPTLVIVFAFVLTYGNEGIVNTVLGRGHDPIPFLYNFWAIVHAHVFFNLGFSAKQMILAYERIPRQHWWTASSLALGPRHRLWHIEWPALRPTVLNQWLLVFSLCITSFAVVLVLGGSPDLTSLEVLIYQYVRYEWNEKLGLAAGALQFFILMFIALSASALQSSLGATRQAFGQTQAAGDTARLVTHERKNSAFHRARGVSAQLVVGFAFVWLAIPLLAISKEGIAALSSVGSYFVTSTLVPSLITSLQVAVPTSLLTTGIGLILAQCLLRMNGVPPNSGAQNQGHQGPEGSPRKTGRSILTTLKKAFAESTTALLSIGLLALSPTILGLSWHVILGAAGLRPFDYALVSVIAVQSVLLTPLSVRIFWGTLRQNSRHWTALYNTLGLPLGYQTTFVEWKALKGQILSVTLLNFAFSMGEVAAPALFGDENFRPLSFLLLESMGAYRFDQASVISMVLLAVALVAFWQGNRKRLYD